MEMGVVYLYLMIFSSLLIISIIKHNLPKKAGRQNPPSLPILPILCHLLTHRGSLDGLTLLLRRFHSLHGPILLLRIIPFSQPSFFISSPSISHSALLLRPKSFAHRPRPVDPHLFLTASSHDISSSSNQTPFCHLLRLNLSSQLTLNFPKISTFSPLQTLLNNLHSQSHNILTPKKTFQHSILHTLAFLCFGAKLGDSDIHQILQLQSFILRLFSQFNIFAFVPRLTKILFYRRWEDIVYARRQQAEIFLPLIGARREKKKQDFLRGSCYVDSLLEVRIEGEGDRRLNDEEIVNLCHEFLSGSATISTALEWTMAEIVKNEFVQRKLVAEIESFVEGIVKEEDLKKMKYVKSVVMESLRRHPPAQFLLPHSVKEEVELNGYLIPVGAELNFSVADVNWDRWIWEDPMEFKPERFMEGGEGFGLDLTGNKGIKIMTFGAGLRLCPGYTFALIHLEFLVANLVREFEWKTVPGREVDLSEELDFTTVMKNSLTVHLVRRRREERRDNNLVISSKLNSFDPKNNLKLFHDVVCELKQDGLILSQHEALLQLTHFHYILQLPYLELNRSLLLDLISRYDKYDNSFSIAEHNLEFKSEHIALLFGLPNHGKPIRLKSNINNDFYNRIFNKEMVSRYEIIYHLRRCAMDKSDDAIEAFVILLIGLFISTVLLPSRSTTIDSSLWSFVEEIDYVNDYAWAPFLYGQLFYEIKRAKTQIAEEDSSDEIFDNAYGGCFLALQLWICEIAGLGKAKKQDSSPRILGWGGNRMDGIFEQFRLLQPSDIKYAVLSPLESERHLLDSTILFACNKQACLQYSTDFDAKDDASTNERYMQQNSFSNVDRQELELLRHITAEQDKRIRHIKEELHRLKALETAPLLSDVLDKVEVKTFDDNCKRKQYDSKVCSADKLDVQEKHGVVSSASIGNESTEKIVKKIVQKRSFNHLASPSVKTKNTELGHSHSGLSSRGKIELSRSLKMPNVKSDHTILPSSEREVKMKVEPQKWNRLFSRSIQANQKEFVNLQSGINARSKLLSTRSKIIHKSGITSRNSSNEDP